MTNFFENQTDNSVKSVNNSVKPTEFWVSTFFLFLVRLNLVLTNFFSFHQKKFKFLKIQQVY
jgi:hypothetical protein